MNSIRKHFLYSPLRVEQPSTLVNCNLVFSKFSIFSCIGVTIWLVVGGQHWNPISAVLTELVYTEYYHNVAGLNTLRQRQNGCHFADNIFKCIFLNENVQISDKISLKFIPKGPVNNIPALVQIMAWRHPGGKPLFEPMMVSLKTHICITRPQWVK